MSIMHPAAPVRNEAHPQDEYRRILEDLDALRHAVAGNDRLPAAAFQRAEAKLALIVQALHEVRAIERTHP